MQLPKRLRIYFTIEADISENMLKSYSSEEDFEAAFSRLIPGAFTKHWWLNNAAVANVTFKQSDDAEYEEECGC